MFISLYVLNTTAKSFHFDIYKSTYTYMICYKGSKKKTFLHLN